MPAAGEWKISTKGSKPVATCKSDTCATRQAWSGCWACWPPSRCACCNYVNWCRRSPSSQCFRGSHAKKRNSLPGRGRCPLSTSPCEAFCEKWLTWEAFLGERATGNQDGRPCGRGGCACTGKRKASAWPTNTPLPKDVGNCQAVVLGRGHFMVARPPPMTCSGPVASNLSLIVLLSSFFVSLRASETRRPLPG